MFVVRRLPWKLARPRPPCPAGTFADQVYGLEPALDSTCAPCTCGAPKGTCKVNVSTYKDTICSQGPGVSGFLDEQCHTSPPRPSLPVSMTAAPINRDYPSCSPSPAALVPAEPYAGVLDTCQITPIPCYHGAAATPDECYQAPAGRLCRTPPGDVCPADFPVRVRVHQDGLGLQVDEFRHCTDCACKATNVACEGGDMTVYCDTTCSGTGACTTPKVVLGQTCTDVTEIMSQPFSWRQTLPVVRGACDVVPSKLSYLFAPREGALCCQPE